MQDLSQQIADFTSFARAHAGESTSIDDLYDRWRAESYRDADALAVQASLRDMAAGETGRPYDEFADAFRERNGVDGRQ